MGLLNIFKKENNTQRIVSPKQSWAKNTSSYISEALKSIVDIKKVRFSVELGEQHPFDYVKVEALTKKFGILSAIIDKHVDFMMSGGIVVKSEDARAQEVIEEFMRDFDFDTNMRIWFRQAFMLGFSPMELSYDNDTGAIDGMKVVSSQTIYVDRNDNGTVEGFNQYLKSIDRYNKKHTEEFETNEIADLNVNVYGDEYYGYGIIYPTMSLINNVLGSNKEMHTIMQRKANTPIVFIGGDKNANGGRGDYPTKEEMDDMGGQFEWLNNKHEWTITDYWKPTTLDFGNIGDKFQFIIDNDIQMLYSAVQIPAVLMGIGSIPEGLAEVQMRAWELRIQSLREAAEKVIEKKIFKPVLNANGLDVHVEVEWGIPSQQEKNNKANTIIAALNNPYLNPKLIEQLEIQLAGLFDIPSEDIETTDEEKKKEGDEKQPRVPGSNSQPPITNPPRSTESCGCLSHHEKYTTQQLEEMDNLALKEYVGFNYKDYEDDVLRVINVDSFSDIKGVTRFELDAGMLNSREISKLKEVMYDGFKNNKSVAEMSRELNKRIEFRNRYAIKDGDYVLNKNGSRRLAISAKNRSIYITRSEVIRLSNQGAIDNYKKNNIGNVRWVASLSDRTCPECESLNGVIFETTNAPMPPLHGLCRCSLAPVVE